MAFGERERLAEKHSLRISGIAGRGLTRYQGAPRKIERLARPPKMAGPRRVRIARQGQQPKQDVFAKLTYAPTVQPRHRAGRRFEAIPGGNSIKHLEVYIGPNDIDVRKIGAVFEKISQRAHRFTNTSIEAASPCNRIACGELDRNLLIPEMQVDYAIADATNRAVSKENIFGEPADVRSEYTVGGVAILEHPGSALQTRIKRKNQSGPKRSPDCGQSLDARH
jgi:hypothetical protein